MGTTYSGQDIYDKIHSGPGPGSLDEAHAAADEIQKTHGDVGNIIRGIQQKMAGSWQGAGSAAAQQSASPVARSATASQDDLNRAQTYLQYQSRDFNNVKNMVQPVPAPPSTMDIVMAASNPISGISAGYKAYQNYSGNQANVQAYQGYVTASGDNQAGMPPNYGVLGADNSTIAVAPASAGPGTGSQVHQYGGNPGSISPGSRTGGSYNHGGYAPPPNPIHGGPGAVPGGNPGGPVPSPRPIPIGGVPIGNDPAGFVPGDPGYIPNPGGPGGPGYNSGAGGPGTGGFTGGGAFGGGAGGFGGGSAGGAGGGRFGGGSGSSGFGGKGAGGGSGFGAGGAQEGMAGRGPGGAGMGAAGKPGGAGQGGMGAGGKGGGKGEEDGEHRSASYLQDDYSGEIVGDLGLTAPPVIGE